MRTPLEKFISEKLEPHVLIITCGLPCTCKTGIVKAISRITDYPIMSSDIIRKEVLKNEDIFDQKVASSMDNRMRVYDEVFRRTEEHLKEGDGAIIDATFITQALRKRAAEIANKYGQTLVILQTRCPRSIAIARILKRTRENYESNALDEQAYTNNEKLFEKVDLEDIKNSFPNLNFLHLIVDTQYDEPDKWYIIDTGKK
jgi:predicted kinase